jgi:hypothetical protein
MMGAGNAENSLGVSRALARRTGVGNLLRLMVGDVIRATLGLC